jgi:hypothetical protein
MPGLAHQAAQFEDAAARECSADLVRAGAASRLTESAGREVSEPRPYRRVEAVSVPTKSDRAGEEEPASRESLNPWEPQEQASPARASKGLRVASLSELSREMSRALARERPEAQMAAVEARVARHAAAPDEAKEWMEAKTTVPTTKEAAEAERDARVLPELLRRFSLAKSP